MSTKFNPGAYLAFPSSDSAFEPGLTKREFFAGLAMQGLLAAPGRKGQPQDFASVAVLCADALLAALEAPEGDESAPRDDQLRDAELNFLLERVKQLLAVREVPTT